MLTIDHDPLTSPDIQQLLAEHLTDMYATSPAESVHALDLVALQAPDIRFFSARRAGVLLGCIAIKELNEQQAEIKSMRTQHSARQQGIGAQLLQHVISTAQQGGYQQLLLETGTEDYFAPARRLYEQHGFRYRAPFADYKVDPNSVFMELTLHQ